MGDGLTANGAIAGNVTDNAVLVFANPSAQLFSGTISGSGSVVKSAAGTLTLAVSNGYTGGTTINGGVLQAGDDNAFGRQQPDDQRREP